MVVVVVVVLVVVVMVVVVVVVLVLTGLVSVCRSSWMTWRTATAKPVHLPLEPFFPPAVVSATSNPQLVPSNV